MNILIAGATGFIGHELAEVLGKNHQLTVLGRDWMKLQQHYTQKVQIVTWEMLPKLQASSFDIIINLCGKNIADSRWNEKVKQELIESRIDTSAILMQWAIDQEAKPRFFCANAIGIYGLQENNDTEALDEDSFIDFKPPKDFLNEIGQRWKDALQPAVDFGIPVTILHFGVVLKKDEGILKKLYPPFYLGLGSILGDGKQTISWIHITDVTAAIDFLIARPELQGRFNLTSPQPLSQEEFARTLAAVIKKPLFLKMPAWCIRKLFGEMGENLLLKGQRVLPKRLVEAGFRFHFPELYPALLQEFPSKQDYKKETP